MGCIEQEGGLDIETSSALLAGICDLIEYAGGEMRRVMGL